MLPSPVLFCVCYCCCVLFVCLWCVCMRVCVCSPKWICGSVNMFIEDRGGHLVPSLSFCSSSSEAGLSLISCCLGWLEDRLFGRSWAYSQVQDTQFFYVGVLILNSKQCELLNHLCSILFLF